MIDLIDQSRYQLGLIFMIIFGWFPAHWVEALKLYYRDGESTICYSKKNCYFLKNRRLNFQKDKKLF
jgi:hypothetical protein